MKKFFSIMSNLQPHCDFKLDFQKVDQHTIGQWLIHCTKHHKEIKMQSPELRAETSREVRRTRTT